MFYADMLKSENVIFPPEASFSQSLTHMYYIFKQWPRQFQKEIYLCLRSVSDNCTWSLFICLSCMFACGFCLKYCNNVHTHAVFCFRSMQL